MKLPLRCRVYEDNIPVRVEWCAKQAYFPAMTPWQTKPSSFCNSLEFNGSV